MVHPLIFSIYYQSFEYSSRNFKHRLLFIKKLWINENKLYVHFFDKKSNFFLYTVHLLIFYLFRWFFLDASIFLSKSVIFGHYVYFIEHTLSIFIYLYLFIIYYIIIYLCNKSNVWTKEDPLLINFIIRRKSCVVWNGFRFAWKVENSCGIVSIFHANMSHPTSNPTFGVKWDHCTVPHEFSTFYTTRDSLAI